MFPKLYVSTRVLLAAACLAGTTTHAAVMDQILDPVYSDGFNDFFSAAQTGQADILLVGDSTVLTGGGWAYALNSGFADSSLGLAGTGLLGGRNDREGEGGGYFQISENRLFGTAAPVNGIRNDDDRAGNNFDYTLPPVIDGQMIGDANNPSDPTFVTPFGTATASSLNNHGSAVRGIEIDGDGIASGGKFTLSVELGNAADNAIGFDVVRRFFDESGAQQTQVVASDTIAANADLSNFNFTFDTDPDYDDSASFTIQTREVAEMDFGIGLEIGSFRLRNDDATGVTVTSWGYGGQTVDDFLTEQYQPLTEDFRQSTLSQITAGGSGELLVVISEGFNDQSAGDTPERTSTASWPCRPPSPPTSSPPATTPTSSRSSPSASTSPGGRTRPTTRFPPTAWPCGMPPWPTRASRSSTSVRSPPTKTSTPSSRGWTARGCTSATRPSPSSTATPWSASSTPPSSPSRPPPPCCWPPAPCRPDRPPPSIRARFPHRAVGPEPQPPPRIKAPGTSSLSQPRNSLRAVAEGHPDTTAGPSRNASDGKNADRFAAFISLMQAAPSRTNLTPGAAPRGREGPVGFRLCETRPGRRAASRARLAGWI